MGLNDKTPLWFLWGVFLNLNLFDYFITSYCVGVVGPSIEGNPLMKAVIEHGGAQGMLMVKMFPLILIPFIIMSINSDDIYRKLFRVLVASTGAFVLIVAWGIFCVLH